MTENGFIDPPPGIVPVVNGFVYTSKLFRCECSRKSSGVLIVVQT